MDETCVDLTSSPEASVPPRSAKPAGKLEAISLLSDSEGPSPSPVKPARLLTGNKRKRGALDANPEDSSARLVQHDANNATAQSTAKLAGSSQPAAHTSATSQQAPQSPDDDDDADLCVPLAFAQRMTSAARPNLHMPSAGVSLPAVDVGNSAALANDASRLYSMPASLSVPLSPDNDDKVYDVPDLDPAPQVKARSTKKAKLDDYDPDDKNAAKQRKKQEAAEAREHKKASALAEKERKKLLREQDKQAKLEAKEQQKLEKVQEKEGNRASKGYYAHQEIEAVLCSTLVVHALGRSIMEKLGSCIKRSPHPCNGLKFSSSSNPMAPYKSICWQRRAVADSGLEADQAPENVPYVLLYFTAAEFVEEVEKDNMQSVMKKCAQAHPGCTLGLLVDKLRLYLMQLDRKACDHYRATGSNPGCLRSEATSTFIADLAVRWPGVRHMLAIDANQAAEYVVNLTSALALQPYKIQGTFLYSFGGTRETASARCLLQEVPLACKERERWMNALVHVPSVPPGAAHAIASNLPSIGSLIQACLDPARGKTQMKNVIKELRMPQGNRRVGPMAANKLLGLLMCEDPHTPMDVFASSH